MRSGTDTDAAARLGGGVEPPGDPKFGVLPPRRDYAVQVNDEPADWGIDDVLDALRRGVRGTTEKRDSDQQSNTRYSHDHTSIRTTMRLTTTADIEQASARIRGIAVQTPLVDVSTRARRPLWLKCENLQVTGSFKLRGAYNMVSRLPEEVRRRGVITYSSGNHAQALAYAARALNVPVVVVMPTTASAIKVEGARGYGAEILREGTTSLERRGRAEQVALERGLTIVPPFDHEDIVAGQGTVGLEILDALPAVSRVYVPLGGGGLLSGVSAAVVQAKPSAKVIGVEPVGAAKMTASLAAGHPVTLKSVGSVADGLLPVRPGDLTFAHVERFVDQVVTVPDEAIERAVAWLFRHAKLVVEPSGAAGVAAFLADADAGGGAMGEKTVAVLSGGNVAPSTLVEIMARAGGD